MIDKAVAASEKLVSSRDLARRLFGSRYDDEISDARRLIAGLAVEEHDGTGRGVPIVFDERNITSPDSRSNPQPNDPCHTLHGGDPPTIVGVDLYNADETGQVSQTLRFASGSYHGTPAVAFHDGGVLAGNPEESERDRMVRLYSQRRAKQGADAFVTADDARIILDSDPKYPPPTQMNRNFMGQLFMSKTVGKRDWEWNGKYVKSRTPGSHANPVKCWQYVGWMNGGGR